MSAPDSNSSASLTASPSITTATKTSTTAANTVRAPPSQQPPPPPRPPPPPAYRALAPVHHPYLFGPFQHPYSNPYAQSIQNRNQNPSPQFLPQDPSMVRGFSTRPVRVNPPFLAHPQRGYHPPTILPHSNLGQNQMEYFMRARTPGIPHLPRPGSGSPVRPRPRARRRVPQPRVAPPPATSNQNTSRSTNARGQDPAVVPVRGRKVRITEGASLNSLCRSWVGNGVAQVGIQMQRRETVRPLPKPLPVEAIKPYDPAEEPIDEDKDDEDSVKDLSAQDLLNRHIERAKKVRARSKEERKRKIARYSDRLALLLPKPEEEEEGGGKKNH